MSAPGVDTLKAERVRVPAPRRCRFYFLRKSCLDTFITFKATLAPFLTS